ncbi:hypothetical protein [Streptomyces subrutilus]|uniref:Uncharacterized protein n=1 Tax=Streptomyces subrutilus TaxID=36818 RepID=A0A1E5NXP0_9ACTN|nr:hypothetical protein [Streptomyces subrutilus]OEJ21028.1 hypothetical protein BGK67_34595 [Streptomyces subrutilus]
MADGRISTRLSGDVAEWLEDRTDRMMTGSKDIQARQELAMWRGALAGELRRIRLTVDQANCLADVMNGTIMDAALAGSAGIVFYNAADAFQLVHDSPFAGESTYGAKWGIDEEALLKYLRGLGPTADHALHDAISRWWNLNAEPTVEGWARVGLTVAPSPHDDGEGEA